VEPVSAFRVTVHEEDEDHAAALLYEEGTLGTQVEAAGPGESCFLAYFPTSPELLSRLTAALAPLADARVVSVPIPEVDWVARFREGFRAFHAAGFLIAPEWDVPNNADASVIVVDPGQAFGTGTHETTRLCLGALRDLAQTRDLGHVLDIGTGSAILAVAAVRLGARVVVGIENDPDALPSAAAHARLNRTRVHLVRGDGARGVREGAFDVVVANITAPLLRARHDEILAASRPGGIIVLSGLLRDELPLVGERYSAAGAPAVLTDGDWAALVIQRPDGP
jgi:ribosomal protein L11 methyltransferase